MVDDEAAAPIAAASAPGGAPATNWALPLAVEDVVGAFVVTELVADCAPTCSDAALSGLLVWGRNDAAPTIKSAMANPANAPAKNPPLLMTITQLPCTQVYLIPTSRTASSSTI